MIDFGSYGKIIEGDDIAEAMYTSIKNNLNKGDYLQINMSGVELMVTKCAKMVFGRLFLELGQKKFFEKIQIVGATENIRAVISSGIKRAIEEQTSK